MIRCFFVRRNQKYRCFLLSHRIYINISRELDLLRELSELCGEKANRTPNISVYDLQHLDKESNEAIVLCGRMKPAYVKLLDIDKYDGKNVEVLKIDTPSRQNREKASFELSQSIRQRLLPVSESRGSGDFISLF